MDANIFLFHALGTNEEAVEFLKRIEIGEIKAVTTSLTLDEVFFKLLVEEASLHLEKTNIFRIKELLKSKRKREEIVLPVMRYKDYIESLITLGLRVLSVSEKDIMDALDKTQKYGLLITDAVYVAIMESKSIKHIASDDKDFREIRGITLWKP